MVKNINAAFVEFERKKCGYYSLSDPDAHFFLNHKKNTKAVPGDELLIQVVKDPVKTKPAMLTERSLSLDSTLSLPPKSLWCLSPPRSQIRQKSDG